MVTMTTHLKALFMIWRLSFKRERYGFKYTGVQNGPGSPPAAGTACPPGQRYVFPARQLRGFMSLVLRLIPIFGPWYIPMGKTIHFIAIGGSVMHQLALALQQKGYTVSGSDDEIYEPALSSLRDAGLLPPEPGWHPERIQPGMDAVILGMHARAGNPELLRAQALGLPLYAFPEYIFRESRDKMRVVVGGSHGKTTITAMIMHVLRAAGRDFDFLVGARLPGFERSVQLSDAPLIVCEGDEYPASALQQVPKFHFYHPHIAVVSGIAWDHINVFPNPETYEQQFSTFIAGIAPGGTLIYNALDPRLEQLAAAAPASVQRRPYGLPPYRIADGVTTVSLGEHTVALQVFGAHNLMNLGAARAVCSALDVPEAVFAAAIAGFRGASRRLEKAFEDEAAVLYRDFAHAPSKVKASIQAVREQFPDRPLAAVLELHTYSSLNASFLHQYRGAMDSAGQACVYFSRHALEMKKLPPLSAEAVREGFGRADLQVADEPAALRAFLRSLPAGPGNLLMMSSGTFDGLSVEEIRGLWRKK